MWHIYHVFHTHSVLLTLSFKNFNIPPNLKKISATMIVLQIFSIQHFCSSTVSTDKSCIYHKYRKTSWNHFLSWFQIESKEWYFCPWHVSPRIHLLVPLKRGSIWLCLKFHSRISNLQILQKLVMFCSFMLTRLEILQLFISQWIFDFPLLVAPKKIDIHKSDSDSENFLHFILDAYFNRCQIHPF